MTGLVETAGKGLLEYGLLGVAVLGLAFVSWRLFTLLHQSQEKRIEEKGASEKAMNDTARALERLTDLLKLKGGAS